MFLKKIPFCNYCRVFYVFLILYLFRIGLKFTPHRSLKIIGMMVLFVVVGVCMHRMVMQVLIKPTQKCRVYHIKRFVTDGQEVMNTYM